MKVSELQISQPFIAIFGSGNSVHDISEEAFNSIKAHSFTISLNYAPIRLNAHLNMWSDRKVSDFLELHYTYNRKDCLFLAQENRTSPAFKPQIDYWFSCREENLQGNYTIVWALQLVKKYFPDKKILLFGLDLYVGEKGDLKWYDRYTDFDLRKRGTNYRGTDKLNQCAEQLIHFVPKKNVFNCNLNSKLDHFEKKQWKELFHLKILHLCPSSLAGSPVHLSKITNKYTFCESKTILKREFTGKDTNRLRWGYDLVNPTDKQMGAAIEWADFVHYHRAVYPYQITDKPSLVQFHTPPHGYKPWTTLSPFNGKKLVIAQYHPRFYTDAKIVPNMIDIWDASFIPEEKSDTQIEIFYSWASETKGGWGKKGSKQTISILNRLQLEYGNRVAIKIMHNRPYYECMAEKRKAHICIDECVTGSYHLQSLEGCAIGAVTFNNIDTDTLGFMTEISKTHTHPFTKSDLKNLYQLLCKYIENPELLENHGLRARKWMEEYWDPSKLVFHYIHSYFNLMGQNDDLKNGSRYLPLHDDQEKSSETEFKAFISNNTLSMPKGTVINGDENKTDKKINPEKSLSQLYKKYEGKDIYIFGTGPSLFRVNPDDFKDKICFGINYSFEVMPHMDYIFVHVIETHETIRRVVDNTKLILPNTLVRQHYRDPAKNILPHRIKTENPEAFIYKIQDPTEKYIDNKHIDFDIDARIFTWSTTTHSAIHIAAYMGAKNIFLVGVDYKLYPDHKVHFKSQYDKNYWKQDWNANNKHREGDIWLANALDAMRIKVKNCSNEMEYPIHYPPKLTSFNINGFKAPLKNRSIVSAISSASGAKGGSGKKHRPLLSICITVKNRSRFLLPNGDTLYLFPNCLKSLAIVAREVENVEVVICDFDSTDWPLDQWVGEVLKQIPYRIIKSKNKFHSGLGRNIAADHAKGEFLLFLDAEMIVPLNVVMNGLKYLYQQKVYFPICFYYLNPAHSMGFWCDGGKGIVFMHRSVFLEAGKWPSPPSYNLPYNIDQLFFKKIKTTGVAIVNQREENYFHQFHPGRSVDSILKKHANLIKISEGTFQPKMIEPPVSVCLLSYKRPYNIQKIVNHLHQFHFVTEIIVWNNQPSTRLKLRGKKVKVIDSTNNFQCYGRFLCAKHAKNDIIYVQDDDAVVKNLLQLYREFLRDMGRLTHGLISKHYQGRHQYNHFHGSVALLGWGAFFKKSWLAVLDEYLATENADSLFYREADQVFSLLLRTKHHPVPATVQLLEHHSTEGIALYREPDHYLHKALAVRQTLAYNRRTYLPKTPVTWNIVIPCRNYGRFLEEAVKSVMCNSADYVITIVDDHSSDNTSSIALEFTKMHSFINYIRQDECRGVSNCRNKGIASVESLFVVLLDADDKIGPSYLHEAENLLRLGYDVINPDAILFGEKHTRWEVPEEVTVPMLLHKNHIHTCAAFKRSWWRKVGGIDEDMDYWQDYEFWIRLLNAGAKIKKLEGDHFYYRKHGTSKSIYSSLNRNKTLQYIRTKHEGLYKGPALLDNKNLDKKIYGMSLQNEDGK